jgi:hypothetical protein
MVFYIYSYSQYRLTINRLFFTVLIEFAACDVGAKLLYKFTIQVSRSQRPRFLRRRSTAARLLRSWVRIQPGIDVCLLCVFVFSGGGLCDDLITRPEESYQLWRIVVCEQGTSWTRSP